MIIIETNDKNFFFFEIVHLCIFVNEICVGRILEILGNLTLKFHLLYFLLLINNNTIYYKSYTCELLLIYVSSIIYIINYTHDI